MPTRTPRTKDTEDGATTRDDRARHEAAEAARARKAARQAATADPDTAERGERRSRRSRRNRAADADASPASSFEARREALRERRAAAGDPAEDKGEPPFVVRVVNAWWNRLISAVFSGKVSEETEQYAAHRTTRDYVCNSIGNGAWGILFPVLTIVATQLVGTEQAGMLSTAMVVGQLLLFVANYGVRTYQVSDVDEMQSFLDYQINRFLTCALMMVVGLAYIRIRGYGEPMASVCLWVFVFRAVDGLADVYEGRLQQKDKLYLAGISQAVRCVLAVVAFTVVLLVTRNLTFASCALAIGAIASFVLFSLPVTLFETERSYPASVRGIGEIFRQCLPLFLALFLYNLVDSMPKFAIEGLLGYDEQLYYNALYFPAHAILMTVGLVYKPQLLRLANISQDPAQRRRFNLLMLAMFAVVAVITGVMAAFMWWLGIPLLSFFYGVDFAPYRSLSLVMVVTGGLCSAIDFLYQIITILREQGRVTRIYLISVAFSVPICWLLVGYAGLSGAVVASLVVMGILFVLLVSDFSLIRRKQG